MPEVLSKYPDITLEVLSSAGARCGQGAPQEILKACPAARFCKLPGGEICVYGLQEAPRMTQLNPADWQAVLGAVGARASPVDPGGGAALAAGTVAVLIAALAARAWRAHRSPRR